MKDYLASWLEKNSLKNLAAVFLVLLAAVSRVLPHWPNFTAVGAMALFSGAILVFSARSILTVFLSLFVTDLILGFHSTMIAVYGAMAMSVFIGSWMFTSGKFNKQSDSQTSDQSGKQFSKVGLVGFSVLNSLSFFVVTNFAVWALDHMYATDAQGLIAAYTMGLPFLPQQILGDLFYTGIIFYGYQMIANRYSFSMRNSKA